MPVLGFRTDLQSEKARPWSPLTPSDKSRQRYHREGGQLYKHSVLGIKQIVDFFFWTLIDLSI